MELKTIHSDKRGTIYSVTGELKTCPEITIMTTKMGYARGGCLHDKSSEHLCVIEGKIEYVCLHEGEEKCFILETGQSFTIPPNTPHYFVALEDCVVSEFGPTLEEKQGKYKPYRDRVMEINNL